MHASVYEWVGSVFKEFELAHRPTLEVGSGNVNGTVRDHFRGEYLGVDIAPGDGVDLVADAETLGGVQDHWQVIVSTEMLEHVKHPWRAVRAMAVVAAPGAHLMLTARGYDQRGVWEPHAFPHDYWRFSDGSMRAMAEDAGLAVLSVEQDPEGPDRKSVV